MGNEIERESLAVVLLRTILSWTLSLSLSLWDAIVFVLRSCGMRVRGTESLTDKVIFL